MLLGLFLNYVSNIQDAMQLIRNLQFDGLVCPIINPLHRNQNSTRETDDEFTNAHLTFSSSDLVLKSKQWRRIIAKLNSDIDCDSIDTNIRKASEKFILQEIQLAQHLVSEAYIMIKLTSNKNDNLARILSSAIRNEICLIHVPITNTTSKHLRRDLCKYPNFNSLNVNTSGNDSWSWWNKFRITCDYNPKYMLALELTEEVPLDNEINRWLGEPIDCVIIPQHLFYKKRQILHMADNILKLIEKFLHHKVYFILQGNINEPEEIDKNCDFLVDFMNSCIKVTPPDYNAGFEDKLIFPIPINDYTRAQIYPVVEADIVFFQSYRNAIESALIDKVPEPAVENTVLLILGDIRGLLVRSALDAAEKSKRKIKIYVVENNSYNLNTLCSLKKELWSEKNIVIVSDLKYLNMSGNVDILISSHIGSFGDNDLLPESLDKAKIYLKPNGITIPCRTTSYINPIMSTKIFNRVRSISKFEKDIKGLMSEYNFLVYLHNVYHIDAPKKCFTFNYPNYEYDYFNQRFKCIHFTSQLDCVLHGFAGYFEAILYKNIVLSIHPQKITESLLSFYPYYFPIKDPQMISAGEEIELNISRRTSAQKVWYEWQINKPKILSIHNSNGRSFSIPKYRDE